MLLSANWGLWSGVVAAVIVSAGFAWGFHHYIMRLYKARAWMSRGAVLVDVDTPSEFALHHPRAAINIPLDELASRSHELGGHERPIVVFAHNWRLGAQAVHELRSSGFWEVTNAAGLVTDEQLEQEPPHPPVVAPPEREVELARTNMT